MFKRNIVIALVLIVLVSTAGISQAQQQNNPDFPAKGMLVLTGGSFTKEGMEVFVKQAGGAEANFLFVPSASSGIKLPSGYTWEPADSSKQKIDSFEMKLAQLFGVKKMKLLHTTQKAIANSNEFCAALKKANGVWLGPGNAGRYASIFLGTTFQKELENLLARNGVIGGNSAGSIIQCSYIVRGKPDKPVLMANGSEQGFGFLKNFVIDPHLVSAKRETELINVLDRYPELIGFGVDDEVTLIVINGVIERKGNGPVYVYDNKLHDKKWWYELPAGSKFSLAERKVIK